MNRWTPALNTFVITLEGRSLPSDQDDAPANCTGKLPVPLPPTPQVLW